MDLAYEFEQKCREAGRELFAKVVDMIKSGEGSMVDARLHMLAYEMTDSMVPLARDDAEKHVKFLKELWDDVDRDGTFDQALRQAIFFKASSFVGGEFDKHGSDKQLGALKEAYRAAEDAMRADDFRGEYERAGRQFAEQFKTLGWSTTWPPTEPSLVKVFEDNQDPAEPALETPAPRLNLVRRPSGPR